MKIPGQLAHLLPWWATKNWSIDGQNLPILIQTDGTCVVGIEVKGRDLYSSDNDLLNTSSDTIREILNELEPKSFLQAIWETGGASFDELIDEFEGRTSKSANPILKKQRARRAEMFRGDDSLIRGSLTYWIGIEKAFGKIAQKAKGRGQKRGFIEKLIGPTARSAEEIKAEELDAIAKKLHSYVVRIIELIKTHGNKASVLAEGKIIEALYRSLNPESSKYRAQPIIAETPQALSAACENESMVILRPFTLREQIPNGPFVENEDSFSIDEPPILHRALGLQRLPQKSFPNILGKVQCGLKFPYRLSITHQAFDSEGVRRELTRRRDRMQAQASGERRDLAAEIAQDECESILEDMITEDEKVFETSANIIVRAESKPALDERSYEVLRVFADQEIGVSTQYWAQQQAFLSTLPGNGYRAQKKFRTMSRVAADLTLLGRPSEGDKAADLLYHNRQNGIFKLSIGEGKPSKHALMFGGTGSGKSFHLSSIIENALAQGSHVIIIDVQGPEISSYRRLTELFGGNYYALAAANLDISLNPFFAHKEMLSDGVFDDDKVTFLKKLIVLMASSEFLKSEKSAFYLSVAQTAIEQAYLSTDEEGEPPTLSDVVAALKEFDATEPEYEEFARNLYLHLKEWINDKRRGRLLNQPKPFEMSGKFNVFDFYGLKEDEQLASALLFVCSNLIWNQLSKDRAGNKLIVFDEAWALIQNEEGADLVENLYRTARKFNGAVFAVSQSATDILNAPVKDAVVNNTGTFFLQKHNHGFEEASEVCSLTPKQKSLLKMLEYSEGKFAECLVVDKARNEANILRLIPTPFELWLNTTNPIDTDLREKTQKSQKLSFLEAIELLADKHPTGAPKP